MNRINKCLWFIYLAVLLAPNIYFVSRPSFYGGTWDAVQFLLFAAIAIVLPLTFIPLRWFLITMTPILFLVPFALMHISILGRPVSTGMIVSAVYGTQREAFDIINSSPGLVITSLLMISAAILSALFIYKNNSVLPLRGRRLASAVVLAGYIAISWPLDSYNSATAFHKFPLWKIQLLMGDREDGGRGDLFPSGLLSRLWRVAFDSYRLEDWKAQRLRNPWQMSRKKVISNPEIHVLVLGEAARRDHMQVYGYHRETTPELFREKNLVALNQIVSPANITVYAVPQLLTRARPHTIDKAYQEQSIISAYRAAGFKTFWISNAEVIDENSTPITMLAQDADRRIFSNDPSVMKLDSVLVEHFDEVLLDPEPKKLIVLHMQGSHFDYSQRYSKEFDKFKPSYFEQDKYGWKDISRKQELINTYDNTLVYTDFVLGQILRRLKNSRGHATMTFVSDHGERLMDQGGGDILHSSMEGSSAELEVPFLVWLNEAYTKDFPEKALNLRRNKSIKASSFILFDSLLGLADLEIAGHSAKEDIFSSEFTGSARPVLLPTRQVLDFDKDIVPRESADKLKNSH